MWHCANNETKGNKLERARSEESNFSFDVGDFLFIYFFVCFLGKQGTHQQNLLINNELITFKETHENKLFARNCQR